MECVRGTLSPDTISVNDGGTMGIPFMENGLTIYHMVGSGMVSSRWLNDGPSSFHVYCEYDTDYLMFTL